MAAASSAAFTVPRRTAFAPILETVHVVGF
jgi:hypothetical protein